MSFLLYLRTMEPSCRGCDQAITPSPYCPLCQQRLLRHYALQMPAGRCIPILRLPFAHVEGYLVPPQGYQLPEGRETLVAIQIIPGRLTLVIAKVPQDG